MTLHFLRQWKNNNLTFRFFIKTFHGGRGGTWNQSSSSSPSSTENKKLKSFVFYSNFCTECVYTIKFSRCCFKAYWKHFQSFPNSSHSNPQSLHLARLFGFCWKDSNWDLFCIYPRVQLTFEVNSDRKITRNVLQTMIEAIATVNWGEECQQKKFYHTSTVIRVKCSFTHSFTITRATTICPLFFLKFCPLFAALYFKICPLFALYRHAFESEDLTKKSNSFIKVKCYYKCKCNSRYLY